MKNNLRSRAALKGNATRPLNDRGQGRKKGVPMPLKERMHRKAVNNKKKENETPLQYMMRAMRDPRTSQKRKDEMAKACAPFIHPRLTTQKIVGGNSKDGDQPLQHKFEIELVEPKKDDDDEEGNK